MRLFVAGRLPEAFQAQLFDALSAARRAAAQARWVQPGALHLTLAFLGEHDPAVIPALLQALKDAVAPHPAVQLWLQGAGCFGRPHQPDVLFAEVAGDAAQLQALRADVHVALHRWLAGPETSGQPFHPHLTLARARGRHGDAALARCRRALREQRLGGFLLEAVGLFASNRTASGARHTELASFALGALAAAHP